MQVSLVNRSGIPVKGGEFVKLHSRYKDSFVVCDYWDIEKIGTIAEAGYPGRWVLINLFNTVNWADIQNAPSFYTKEELATPGAAIVDWENIVNEPINVSALFLDNSPSDISGYHKLLPSPSSTAQVEDSAQSNNSAEVLIEAYAMDSAFGSLLLSGGAWHFVIFGRVNSNVGVSTIVIRVYKRTALGVETELFSLQTPELTTAIVEHEIESVQPDFMVEETDRLVIKFFAKSTSVPLRTIFLYHNGVVNYSHVHTTFSITFNTGGLALGETAATAYRGDRGKTAYDHSQTAHLAFSGLAKITVGPSAPVAPSIGDIWINTN
jgi:hypothetical protein